MHDKSQESRSSLDEVLGSRRKSNEHNKDGKVMDNGTTKADIQSPHCDLLPDSLSKAKLSSGEHASAIQHHEHPISSISVSRSEVQRERNNGFLSHDNSKNISFLVKSSLHSLGTNGHAITIQHLEDVKEIDVLEDASVGGAKSSSNLAWRFNRKNVSEFQRNVNFDNKVHELESRIEKLEGELREAAAIECAVYTIVAEHGCSLQKMHSPARRLSRLYIQASARRKANTAKSALSGLTLIARACGNDVSRLTFWLTNTIVLRTFLSHTIGHSDKPNSSKHLPVGRNSLTRTGKKSSLKWGSNPCQEEQFALTEELENWEDPQTFVSALEKLESWIFCRIVESVWWQTFTPYMQTSKEFGQSLSFTHQKKRFEKECSFNDRRQECYSFEIWKKAFQDASEKLCPVRADARECGCLPIIAKLVIEQCVARLDVAMLNALLRESDDELPTDPVADPISKP
ncbi:hypothetical protein HPP92_024312 [Vanilla planifolia]|uniref:Uncharacterized protein n=1 Tax=Vanilla planifolia TaxID=51239 RepID=A0A835PRS5_VANPL|nr:hypothetical protein HPP92_024312 [Vanilla planifolia]